MAGGMYPMDEGEVRQMTRADLEGCLSWMVALALIGLAAFLGRVCGLF